MTHDVPIPLYNDNPCIISTIPQSPICVDNSPITQCEQTFDDICVTYTGNNTTCSRLNTGDSLNTAINKIDLVICELINCCNKIK
jgi:hypothetical protein